MRAGIWAAALPAELETAPRATETHGRDRVRHRDSDAQSAFVTLGDTTGAPVLLVELKLNHDITNRGMAAGQFALYVVLLVGLLTLLLVVGVLNRRVSSAGLRSSSTWSASAAPTISRSAYPDRLRASSAPAQRAEPYARPPREDNARRGEAEHRLNQTEDKYRRLFEDSVGGVCFSSRPTVGT